ncbi:MAG: RsmD family RNA methyltransferase, partial [Mycobacteriales bacterium]
VHAGDLGRLLAGAPTERYGVVFLDPPYADPVDAVLVALDDNGWLAAGATLVVERSSRSREPAWPLGWRARSRAYGETTLWYVRAP